MPGVGPTLGYTLLALLPELGQIGRKQIAALVGLAPYDFDSGRFRGQRHIYGGGGHAGSRPQPREARWRAAPVLTQHARWATPAPNETQLLARCPASARRSRDRTDSGRSALAAGTGP